MKNKFDELAKGMAQSVTRRQALKKFGIGLAGMALACFGLANRAEARCGDNGKRCKPGQLHGCCGGFCCPTGTAPIPHWYCSSTPCTY